MAANKTKPSHVAALCGVAAALGVVLMLAGSLIGVGIYAAPMVAGLLLLPVRERCGTGAALLCFLATTLMCALLGVEAEQWILYLVFFGWYPLALQKLSTLPRAARIAVKFLCFNVPVVAAELLLIFIVTPQTVALWPAIGMLALANVTFALYDRLIPRAAALLDKTLSRALPKP